MAEAPRGFELRPARPDDAPLVEAFNERMRLGGSNHKIRLSKDPFPTMRNVPGSGIEVEQFLYAEARMLDDRDFEGWLDCYAPDAEFWMPAWDDDDTLVTDPQREISLIWYGNRGGLEDRVFRIRTERSSATSLPEASSPPVSRSAVHGWK